MNASPHSDPQLDLFRHTVASLAYRAGKAVRNAPAKFADFNDGSGGRTPGQILAHMGDLFVWALSIAKGKQEWHNSNPLPWEQEAERFFAALKNFDDFLATGKTDPSLFSKLFQGPVADALTHTGQLAMLRRMADVPIKGENYFIADVAVGRLGTDQAAPKLEF